MTYRMSDVGALLDEYKSLSDLEKTGRSRFEDYDWERVKQLLVRNAGWTNMRAEILIEVACNDRIYMLRNALALAIAARIENSDS